MKESEKNDSTKVVNKYALKNPIDLQSKFLEEVETDRLAQIETEKQMELQEQLKIRLALERLDVDPEHGKRLHAWVVILSNVKWAAKKTVDGTEASNDVKPFFIEPTTGAHFSVDDASYLGIESIWNDHNYYVRCAFSRTTISIEIHFVRESRR